MSAHVLGLDLGLAHAGAAQIHMAEAQPPALSRSPADAPVFTQHLQTDPLPADAPIELVADRLRRVARWAVERATTSTVLVVIEGPSHGSDHGQAHERAGIWWRVVDQFVRHEVPIAVIPPKTAKKYIAGSGNADKHAVRHAVAAAWPGRGLHSATDHEADAVALATCGVDWLGWPGPWLDGRRGASLLTAVRWPEREAIRA